MFLAMTDLHACQPQAGARLRPEFKNGRAGGGGCAGGEGARISSGSGMQLKTVSLRFTLMAAKLSRVSFCAHLADR